MGRTVGSINKTVASQDTFTLSEDDRLEMIAVLIVELIEDDLCSLK